MIPPVAVIDGVKAVSATGGLRLNLGGRETRLEGFKNVDLFESENTDIVADISDLRMIEDGTVDELYASNCLEHFSHRKTLGVLKEWGRVLKRGGRAWISVPDFDVCVKLYVKHGLVPYIKELIWGGQEYDLAFHYVNFTWPFLARLVADAGFSDIKRHKFLPFNVNDASRNVDNKEHIPVSLNVEAIK